MYYLQAFLPLAGLEEFCRGSLLYSPLFKDLASAGVPSTLLRVLRLLLYPAVSLVERAVVEAALSEVSDDGGLWQQVADVLLSCDWSSECLLPGGGEEGGPPECSSSENWVLLATVLAQALVCLSPGQLERPSNTVSVCVMFTSDREVVIDLHANSCLFLQEVKLAPLIKNALTRTLRALAENCDFVKSLFSSLLEK